MAAFFENLKLDKIFAKRSTSVLGIDIGSSAIKVVQLRKEKGVAKLETYGELALGPYAGVAVGQATNLPIEKRAEALRDVIREAKVTTSSAGVSIPFASSLLTIIELPQVDTKELNKMVPIEARKYIPVPIGEVVLDWFIVPSNREQEDEAAAKEKSNVGTAKKVEVLLVAIHNEVLSNHALVMEQANLTSDFYEIEIFSTIRAVLDQNLSPAMVVDIGAATTKVYLVEYGIVKFSHIINRGSQDVTVGLSKSLKISPVQAEEIKRKQGLKSEIDEQNVTKISLLTLDYIFSETNRVLLNYQRKHNKNVGRVVLTGGGAIMNGVAELAKRHLETEVILGDPFAKVATPAFLEGVLKEAGPEFAVAVGLALRKLQELDV